MLEFYKLAYEVLLKYVNKYVRNKCLESLIS